MAPTVEYLFIVLNDATARRAVSAISWGRPRQSLILYTGCAGADESNPVDKFRRGKIDGICFREICPADEKGFQPHYLWISMRYAVGFI